MSKWTPTPGIHQGVPQEDYHADRTAVSNSWFGHSRKSLAHLREYLDNGMEETDAMRIGSAVHACVLEPDEFDDRYAVAPLMKDIFDTSTKWHEIAYRAFVETLKKRDQEQPAEAWKGFCKKHINTVGLDRRTAPAKAVWNAFVEENEGKDVLTADEWDMVHRMRDQVRAHPLIKEALAIGEAEVTSVWKHGDILCKSRADWLHPERVVVDVKTCKDASLHGFSTSVGRYGYFIQDPFYSDGFAANIQGNSAFDFIFVAIEKSPPYNVGVYRIDDVGREFGRECYHRELERIYEAQQTGNWPGYPQQIQDISLPAWAFYTEEIT